MRHLAPLLLLALTVGCHRPPPGVSTHPVEGRVYVHGRPAKNVRVMFHPLHSSDSVPRYPVGVTTADGTFHLTTLLANDGAPEGEYAVIVLWPDENVVVDECDCPDPATHDRLRGEYADPARTTLRATVRPGPNQFSFHADPGARGWNLPRQTGEVGRRERD